MSSSHHDFTSGKDKIKSRNEARLPIDLLTIWKLDRDNTQISVIEIDRVESDDIVYGCSVGNGVILLKSQVKVLLK